MGVSNINVNILSNQQTQVSWNSNGNYIFSRLKYRINGPGQSWAYFGGFGHKIFYPNSNVVIDSLQHGQRYRAVVRLYCDSIISSFSSSWSSPVSWRQNLARYSSENIDNLIVFPNPSENIFNISFVSNSLKMTEIRIFNIMGSEIFFDNFEFFIGKYSKRIDLKNYNSGIYFLEIKESDHVIFEKIILK